jgi:hypothetical protein
VAEHIGQRAGSFIGRRRGRSVLPWQTFHRAGGRSRLSPAAASIMRTSSHCHSDPCGGITLSSVILTRASNAQCPVSTARPGVILSEGSPAAAALAGTYLRIPTPPNARDPALRLRMTNEGGSPTGQTALDALLTKEASPAAAARAGSYRQFLRCAPIIERSFKLRMTHERLPPFRTCRPSRRDSSTRVGMTLGRVAYIGQTSVERTTDAGRACCESLRTDAHMHR